MFVNVQFLRHFPKYRDYKIIRRNGLIVQFPIDGKTVRISVIPTGGVKAVRVISPRTLKETVSLKWRNDLDVCVIDQFVSPSRDFIKLAKDRVSTYRKACPTSPIILVGNHDRWKGELERMKKAELKGDKLMNRKIGNQLANEIGAVKYLEYSRENGRGVETLFDEIALAHLERLKEMCWKFVKKRFRQIKTKSY